MNADFDFSGFPPKLREILDDRLPLKRGAAVPDAAGASPTKEEFNALLASLREAGVIVK